MERVQSLLGLLSIVALAWAMSENRRRFPVRLAILGLSGQIALALLLLKISLFQKDRKSVV
jgi:CNT family concentrative nucleoside transporter